MCDQLATERVGRNVVDERLLTPDRHHRNELAVAALEIVVTGDVDLGELEAELVLQLLERGSRPVTEVAPGRVVEDDVVGYG